MRGPGDAVGTREPAANLRENARPQLKSLALSLAVPDQGTQGKRLLHRLVNMAMKLLVTELGAFPLSREAYEQEDLPGAPFMAIDMVHDRMTEFIDGYP